MPVDGHHEATSNNCLLGSIILLYAPATLFGLAESTAMISITRPSARSNTTPHGTPREGLVSSTVKTSHAAPCDPGNIPSSSDFATPEGLSAPTWGPPQGFAVAASSLSAAASSADTAAGASGVGAFRSLADSSA
eukprot:CAMPEP_0115699566 /NCGR_PEP_ID=MMETSP0272-20121206/66947_1 /TAXON_ID=71861 /ORGANISM="Scrippsiella trochoidea, Strain CCMP3099" /LENGTH=134 /DNA_ID=CAMNT_0003139999 /DNA_START=67 /DNA_END=472 /DNA_ORIENTATION=-